VKTSADWTRERNWTRASDWLHEIPYANGEYGVGHILVHQPCGQSRGGSWVLRCRVSHCLERDWTSPRATFRNHSCLKPHRPVAAGSARAKSLTGNCLRIYDAKKFRDAVHQPSLDARAQGTSSRSCRLCAQAGVAVAFVREIRKCPASGQPSAVAYEGASSAQPQIQERRPPVVHLLP